jgi:hypothetical protein
MKRNWFDIHPKITAASLAGGATLVVEGVCQILGVPAPSWAAPVIAFAAPIIAGYLKTG